ncbi:MAG: histidine kinase [Flavobacteriales bacterium]
MKHYIAFVVILITGYLPLNAQQMLFFEKDRDQGLPSNEIFDLATHSSGLMYVSFDKGLFEFNGNSFKKIPFKNYKSNSVTSVCFDAEGTTWCRNFSNQIFYMKNDSMFPLPIETEILGGENIIDLKSNKKFVYCITESKLIQIDPITKKIESLLVHPNLFSFDISESEAFLSSADGKSLITKDLAKTQITTDKKSRVTTFNGDFYTAHVEDNSIKIRRRYQNNLNDFSRIPCEPNTILLNFQHSSNYLFAATNNGIFIIERDGTYQILPIKHRVSDAAEDREGGIWIATLDNGLIHIPSTEIVLEIPNPLDQQFNDITLTNEGYVACTNKGNVIYFDRNFHLQKELNPGNGSNLGFIKFDAKTGAVFTTTGTIDQHNAFQSYYFGKDVAFTPNNIIYGTHAGLYVKNITSLPPYFNAQKIEHIITENGTFYSIRKQRVRKIQELNPNELLVAFSDGLYYYSASGSKEILDENGQPIFATSLFQINNYTWITTTNNGLIGLNGLNIDFHYTEKNGLSSNLTLDAIFNENNELYVITGTGIDRLNPLTGYIYSLSDNLGISHLNFYKLLQVDETIIAVSNKGIISIPQKIEKNRPLPIIHLNGLYNKKHTWFNHNSQLSYDNNNVTLKWNLYSFTNANATTIQARILPINEEWVRIPAGQNEFIINNLIPGKYTFEIQVPFENSTLKKFNFEILTPWWHLWWIRLLEVFSILFIIYFVFKKIVNYYRKKQEVKAQLIQSQLTALHAQMNPHFLYNVLNSLQGMIYSKRINEAGNFVSFFSEHLRNILKVSDQQEISLKSEIEGLKTYLQLEKFRFETGFNYKIIKHPDLQDHLQIPSMIIQPFVENALKHGLLNKQGEKQIQVEFTLNNPNEILVTIQDNGIGRKASAEINEKRKDKPDSFATHAIYNRIELINKVRSQKVKCDIIDLSDEKQNATGTKVELTIPILEQ